MTINLKLLANGILIYIQQDATLHSLLYLETALHVSGGTITHHQERKQLYLQHLVFVTPATICRYRGRVGIGLSVLSVACDKLLSHKKQVSLNTVNG